MAFWYAYLFVLAHLLPQAMNTLKRQFLIRTVCALSAASALPVLAQGSFPSKSVTITTAFAAGNRLGVLICGLCFELTTSEQWVVFQNFRDQGLDAQWWWWWWWLWRHFSGLMGTLGTLGTLGTDACSSKQGSKPDHQKSTHLHSR